MAATIGGFDYPELVDVGFDAVDANAFDWEAVEASGAAGPISGVASITVDDATLLATGVQSGPVGAAAITLGDTPLTATGVTPEVGVAAITLGDTPLTAAGVT